MTSDKVQALPRFVRKAGITPVDVVEVRPASLGGYMVRIIRPSGDDWIAFSSVDDLCRWLRAQDGAATKWWGWK